MRLLAATALAAILAASTAQAQSMGEKSGINSLTGTAPSTQDFVTEAGGSDMFEIMSSQLADTKSDAQAKTFAAKMIQDHTKTTNEMKAMVSDGKVKATLPTGMTSSQQSMFDKLKGYNGADFDKQYWSDQVSAHKDAVGLFERYAKGGDNDNLKKWADTTLPALRDHLKMAQDHYNNMK